jgi:EAL domain-containing protein (putative c-di-GMP-specific phosphodiesterase class I)
MTMAEEQENIVEKNNDEVNTLVKPNYLEMTIQSDILPLEMRYSQINGCYSKRPLAYRSFTYINSVIEGVIPPERYMYAADETDRGKRLSVWNISQAIKTVQEFEEAGKMVDFVTARISPSVVRESDFYSFVKNIFRDNDFTGYDKICFEFPRTVLFEDKEQVRLALINLKLLKIKSMISGCGEKDNPVTLLMTLPFDYVVLAPWLIPLSDDRVKRTSFESFLAFLTSTGCKIIADGVRNDSQIQVLSRNDCYGYIPSEKYEGSVKHGELRMTFEDAKLQGNEEDFDG